MYTLRVYSQEAVMLELKDIKKTYRVGDIETKALDGINLSFRDKEFVAILGTSGSGKTTCLNMIGGLDHYDSGDLIIKGKSTKAFKEYEWDAYRNNSVGFVFQSYNLISHISIVANVEMGMTLSGVSKQAKRKKALDILEKVGLKEHLHKKPNQLSGGQMQRVAIARALANDPEILLCDEPTGALDSTTSVQIMDLIKGVSKDRLVIMVTHNPQLAKTYADRIIRFSDGKIIDDTNPYGAPSQPEYFHLKKTGMSFLTALNLSFRNLWTKKGRTFLTALASSIGIIGIAVILSLSTGFRSEIDEFQFDAMAEFPIIISQETQQMNANDLNNMTLEIRDRIYGTPATSTTDDIVIVDSSKNVITHKNDLSQEFIDYLENVSPDIVGSIGYTRVVQMNLLRKTEDKYLPITLSNGPPSGNMTSSSSVGLSSFPSAVSGNNSYLADNYELLAGDYPRQLTDVVLVLNNQNQIEKGTLGALGFTVEGSDRIAFSAVVGTEYRVIHNNDFYTKTSFGTYLPANDYEKNYTSEQGFTIRISGVVRPKAGTSMSMLASGIAYDDQLSQKVIDNAINSDIVKAQRDADYNVLTREKIDANTKELLLAYLGGDPSPYMVMVFPKDFDAKDEVINYIEQYNVGKDEEDVITFTDLAGTLSSLTKGIMDGITLVLIAFAAISLVVSMIMISIITYTSVLERTKEIGILKALGARKKDITRVFDAETFILGVFSGVLGVMVAWSCTFPINQAIHESTGLTNASHLRLDHAVLLVILSTVITVLGGHIPARLASQKDAVEALRTE